MVKRSSFIPFQKHCCNKKNFINTFMGSIESFLSPMKIFNTHMHVLAIPMSCIHVTYHNAKFKFYKFWCMEYITPHQLPPQKFYSICACDSLLILSYLVKSLHNILQKITNTNPLKKNYHHQKVENGKTVHLCTLHLEVNIPHVGPLVGN